jgi:hypothetical protein
MALDGGNKIVDIPLRAAPEAFVAMREMANRKRRRAFAMKRAMSDRYVTVMFEPHVTADDVHNVGVHCPLA